MDNKNPLLTPQVIAAIERLRLLQTAMLAQQVTNNLTDEERDAMIAQKVERINAQNATRNMVGDWDNCVFKPQGHCNG